MAPTRDSAPTPPEPPTGSVSPLAAGRQPAPLGRRVTALLIDWMLSVLLSTAFADPLATSWPAVVVLIFDYAVFIGLFGQTPGMAVARLRCVSYADGGAIGIPKALLRGILLTLIVPTVIMDESRRGLHDRAAGSIVVSAPPRGTA